MSTTRIPFLIPSLLLGLSSLLACVAHDTPTHESSLPEGVDETDSPAPEAATTVKHGTPVQSAPHDCEAFRTPGLDEKTRRGRLAYATNAAARMLDDEPHLPETLLWIAELELQDGNVDGACKALQRLTTAPEGPLTETGRCWHDAWCVAAADLSCPTGFSSGDHQGCAPVDTCSLDLDEPVEPQLAGACETTDVACCAKEGGLSQVLLFRARDAGDTKAAVRHRADMVKLYERSCDQGYASLCAFVAKAVREGGDGSAPDPARADRLQARACALGHHASCLQ